MLQGVESQFHIYIRRANDRLDRLVEEGMAKGYSQTWKDATYAPVYLGRVIDKEGSDYDYANIIGDVKTADMKKMLVAHAKQWSQKKLEQLGLQDFFKRSEDGKGFVEAERNLISIDHIVPVSFGGYDHPRNYILMTQSVNSSYQDKNLDEKVALIGKVELRRLKLWLQEMHKLQSNARTEAYRRMKRRDA
jgi:hypothetical protein